jgi:hypothetical protein
MLAAFGSHEGATLMRIGLEAAAGGLLYLWLFVAIAIGRRDRALYTSKALEIIGRRPLPSAV